MIPVDGFLEGHHTGDHHHVGRFIHAQPSGIDIGQGLRISRHVISSFKTKDSFYQTYNEFPHTVTDSLKPKQVYLKRVLMGILGKRRIGAGRDSELGVWYCLGSV